MKVPFVDLASDHQPIRAELLDAIDNVVRRGDFVLGQEVDRFEEEFADYLGVPHAVGVDSGLSALVLLLEAYGVGPGDEVIVPVNSFVATAAAATMVGARPVFVDIDPTTHNLDLKRFEEAITPRTRAVIPVHLYGLPVAMSGLLATARRHGLLIIEDAAQAHGARFAGVRVGTFGDGAAFSFYPAKNLGAFGEAGMAVTSDPAVAAKIRALRNCGQTEKYVHTYTPHNHRLDTVQAAVLRVKLRRLDAWNHARRDRADRYAALLDGIDVDPAVAVDGAEPVWHLYVIRCRQRDALRRFLHERGVDTGVHYPIPIHLQPFYQQLGYERGRFPVAEAYAEQVVSLPMYPGLGSEAIAYVVDVIAEFVERTGRREPLALEG